MPKHPPEPQKTFVFTGQSKNRYCPLCGRVIKYTVPSNEVTYVAHDINDVCVIENQTVVSNG